MRVMRTTKCSLKFANKGKLELLSSIIDEYSRVVNAFIDQFWPNAPNFYALNKNIVNSISSWLSYRLKRVAANEASGMIRANVSRDGVNAIKPHQHGKSMCIGATVSQWLDSSCSSFDRWLRIRCVGRGIKLDLPIKLHRHFNKLAERGTLLKSYFITKDTVQFCFDIQTGEKRPYDSVVAVDTGINHLATLSTGNTFGNDVHGIIERIKRCVHGSKNQRRVVRCLRQRMDEVAKQVVQKASVVVVEDLRNITHNTRKSKRRLDKNMRRSIGRWNVRYWLNRLHMTCEDTNVSFRTVNPFKTSQECSVCGHISRRNRVGEMFLCQKCAHAEGAHTNAAKVILARFLSGPYGARCKRFISEKLLGDNRTVVGTIVYATNLGGNPGTG